MPEADPTAQMVSARLPQQPHEAAAVLRKQKVQSASAIFSATGCSELHNGPLTHIHSGTCQPPIRILKTSPGNLPYGTVSQDQGLFYSVILS